MRVRVIPPVIAALLVLTACDALPTDPANQAPARRPSAARAASRDASAAANQCFGSVVSGINTTWPWAHADKGGFAPPPGAIAKWIDDIGSTIGLTSVRDVQNYFCGQ